MTSKTPEDRDANLLAMRIVDSNFAAFLNHTSGLESPSLRIEVLYQLMMAWEHSRDPILVFLFKFVLAISPNVPNSFLPYLVAWVVQHGTIMNKTQLFQLIDSEPASSKQNWTCETVEQGKVQHCPSVSSTSRGTTQSSLDATLIISSSTSLYTSTHTRGGRSSIDLRRFLPPYSTTAPSSSVAVSKSSKSGLLRSSASFSSLRNMSNSSKPASSNPLSTAIPDSTSWSCA